MAIAFPSSEWKAANMALIAKISLTLDWGLVIFSEIFDERFHVAAFSGWDYLLVGTVVLSLWCKPPPGQDNQPRQRCESDLQQRSDNLRSNQFGAGSPWFIQAIHQVAEWFEDARGRLDLRDGTRHDGADYCCMGNTERIQFARFVEVSSQRRCGHDHHRDKKVLGGVDRRESWFAPTYCIKIVQRLIFPESKRWARAVFVRSLKIIIKH